MAMPSNLLRMTRRIRTTLLILVGPALLALVGCVAQDAITTGAITASGKNPSSQISQARSLMSKRKFREALAILEREIEKNPSDTDTHFLAGESYYRLAKYENALSSFRQSLALDERHIDTRHRIWAARLQAANNTRKEKNKLRQELERLHAKQANNINSLIIIYYGYGYLWDRLQQQHLAREISQIEVPEQLKTRVGHILTTEIILTRDGSNREQLARRYIDHFLGSADDEIPVAALFSLIGKKEPKVSVAETRRLVSDYSQNLYIKYYGAKTLIKTGDELAGPIEILQDNIRAMRAQSQSGRLKRFLAKNFVLLGTANLKNGNNRAAEKWLEEGLTIDPLNASGTYTLGRIHELEGEHKKAISLYARTLSITGNAKDAESRLSRLVDQNLSDSNSVRRLFAKRKKVTTFTDVTHAMGLSNTPAYRVAWGDYDNDGDDDLLIDGRRLFNNSSTGFKEVNVKTGTGKIDIANGGIWGDYNNDGLLDIFVTTGKSNRLLKNTGTGVFMDVSKHTLPDNLIADSQAAAWGNANNDAFLDLYVANYQQPGVERAICSHDTLLINNNGKHYENGKQRLNNYTREPMCGRGISWGDYNNDGNQDIFVSNYRLDPNFLWHNNGTTLENVAISMMVAGNEVSGAYGNSIGPVFADFNNDGELDLFTSNLAHPRDIAFSDESQLFIRSSSGTYKNTYNHSGVRYQETYSDPAVSDIDNDGDLDLFITAIYASGESHLYLNNGKGKFHDVTWLSGARLNNTWGSAFSDFDNDGDTDLVVASRNGIRLLQNDGNKNNWIKVRIRQRKCNRFGVSSRIELRYQNRLQIREVAAGRGTGNQDSLDQIFGLGDYSGPVSIHTRNACGQKKAYQTTRINRLVVLED